MQGLGINTMQHLDTDTRRWMHATHVDVGPAGLHYLRWFDRDRYVALWAWLHSLVEEFGHLLPFLADDKLACNGSRCVSGETACDLHS